MVRMQEGRLTSEDDSITTTDGTRSRVAFTFCIFDVYLFLVLFQGGQILLGSSHASENSPSTEYTYQWANVHLASIRPSPCPRHSGRLVVDAHFKSGRAPADAHGAVVRFVLMVAFTSSGTTQSRYSTFRAVGRT